MVTLPVGISFENAYITRSHPSTLQRRDYGTSTLVKKSTEGQDNCHSSTPAYRHLPHPAYIKYTASMANYEDLEVISALRAGEITKMSNPQLKKPQTTLLSAGSVEQASNNTLLEEIRSLQKQVDEIGNVKQELKDVKQEVNQLSSRLDEAYKVITQQQLFLESMDGKERCRNMLIFGAAEEPDDLGETDMEKVRKVITATGYAETFNPESWELKRLGKPPAARDGTKKRPILVVVENGKIRNEILKGAKNLKTSDAPLSNVYLKKDLHPVVRKELGRLRRREKEERKTRKRWRQD